MLSTMPVQRYRKKPVEIEAFHVASYADLEACAKWVQSHGGHMEYGPVSGYIRTLEGDMRVTLDDSVIRGVKGEFYPCKPDIFDATYDPVPNPQEAQL